MTIYELLGGFFVVFFTCVGIALTGGLASYGAYRLAERVTIGAKFEREGIADALEVREDKIPGVERV